MSSVAVWSFAWRFGACCPPFWLHRIGKGLAKARLPKFLNSQVWDCKPDMAGLSSWLDGRNLRHSPVSLGAGGEDTRGDGGRIGRDRATSASGGGGGRGEGGRCVGRGWGG